MGSCCFFETPIQKEKKIFKVSVKEKNKKENCYCGQTHGKAVQCLSYSSSSASYDLKNLVCLK